MSKARDLADFQGSASALTTGTLPVDRVPYVGRRNLIINGGFDVWQRGTSQTTDGYGSVDRWAGVNTLSGASFSKATRGLRWQGTVGTTPWYNGIAQKIENVWQYLSYQTVVTVSFKLTVNRAESTATAKSSMWDYSRGKNAGEYTLPSVSGTYSYTVDLYEAVDGDIFDLGFYLGDGDYVIENVQLELGSVATPFEHRSYGEELALCQRYYWRKQGSSTGYTYTLGYWGGSTYFEFALDYPVEMRAKPTLTFNAVEALKAQTAWYTCNSVGANEVGTLSGKWTFTTNASGEARGYGGAIAGRTDASYIACDAEL